MNSKSKMIKVFGWSVLPIALVLLLLLQPGRAQAATTFTVKSTADTVDAQPGDGVCADSCGNCTLRAAIMEANAFPGDDTINFDPAVFSVPQTIKLSIAGVNEEYCVSGDLDITSNLTITGAGANVTTIDGAGIDRVLDIRWENQNRPTVSISGLTVTGGKTLSTQPGGGTGGGIKSQGTLLTLTNVTVDDNHADHGGGIFVGGPVTLNSCTVSNNTALTGSFGGGGILNYIHGPLTLNNSTVSGNQGRFAGGIVTTSWASPIFLNNSTVSFNTGGLYNAAGSVTMKNTILANPSGNCRFQGGTLTSLGHNLSTDTWCDPAHVSGGLDPAKGDANNTPAQLAPLALNLPGSTKTHALLPGSPAIDKGGDCLNVDQRGVPRPQGAACDIGAYEKGAATFVVNSTDDVVDAVSGNGSCATAAGVCTLRAAIMEANALPGDDIIILPAGAYTLTIPGVNEDLNATGDLDITSNLTITGPGANLTTIDAGGIDRVFDIRQANTTNVRISGLTVTGGKTLSTQPGGGSGGGILNGGTLTLTNVKVIANTANLFGGGIYNDVGGTLTVNSSTVSGNVVTINGFAGGGGIFSIGIGRTVTLSSSTVSGNTAVGVSFGAGGGIWMYHGTLILNNSTVSGNVAKYGGAINTSNHSIILNLNNSTISGNSSNNGGGGIRTGEYSTINLKNTIVAGNVGGGDCAIGFGNVVNSLGHNLDSDGTCQLNKPTDLPNRQQPLLGPLTNNGGSTQTHALLTGSPAIDKGGDCLAMDQRGVPRPQGVACDIGAYEVGFAPSPAAGAMPLPNMVAWWPMDETSGTTVTDVVGGHNGTARPASIGAFAGSGPVTSHLWPPPTLPVGMVKNSLFFSGDRRVEIPSHADLEPGTGDFTIDAWVNYAASGNGQFLTVARKALGNGGTQTTAPLGSPGGIGYEMIIQDYSTSKGVLSFTMQGAGQGNLGTGGPYITPNTWHHVAFTLQRTSTAATITIYLDGSSTGSTLTTPWTYGNISNTWNLLIGGDGVLAGNIAVDEVGIFKRALSQSEIQAIFNAGSADKCKTVVNPNKPPVANAGPDQTVEATSPSGASVTLNGSGSSDPDSNPLTYNWTGPFATVSAVSHTVTLPLGTHTATLKVSDGQATATDTVTITVRDTTEPDTIINSAVDGNGAAVASGGSTLSASITLTFGGTDAVGVAGFQCSRDGSGFAPCTSPASYSALAKGSHTIQVRAVDAAGNIDPSQASFTWTVITPAQAIENLITTINNMGLPGGVANSLKAPLGQASNLLNDNNPSNDTAACGKLTAFINQIDTRVQNGQLTSTQGSQLLQGANAIKAGLGC